MASFNRVTLLGNLTRDPQLKYLPSQTAVVEFGIACNRKFKTAAGEVRDEATFIDVTAFGRIGEIVNQYCTKGKQILVEGRLKLDSWEDKNGGGKRSKLSVIAENIQLLGSASSPSDGEYDQTREQRRPPPAQSRAAPAPDPETQVIADEDIPF